MVGKGRKDQGRDDRRSGRRDHAQSERALNPGKYKCRYAKYGCKLTFGSKGAAALHGEFCDKAP